MRLLMSIKCEKTYEYRHILPKQPITTIVIYSSSPVQRFIGEFDVDDIVSGSLDEVWATTGHSSGILRSYFNTYFAGKTVATAIPDVVDRIATLVRQNSKQSAAYSK